MPNFSASGATPEFPEGSPQPESAVVAHDPVWRGLDVAIIILFTLFSMVVVLFAGAVLLALLAHLRGWNLGGVKPLANIRFLLLAQTAGFGLGFLFAAVWIKHHYQAAFWRSIAWRKLPSATVGAVALGGVGLSILLQLLGHYLPMPRELPIDRLFSARTAWALAIYGVAIAPFFEEFLFRGLIYPSLRRTFTEGMTVEEAFTWRPVLWVFAALLATLSGFVVLMRNLSGLPADPRALTTMLVAVLMGLLAGPALRLLASLLTMMAQWNRAELFAILVTGVLFGLVHSAQLANALAPVLMLSLVGIILTAVRARTGSLMASWVFHCVYNGTLFFMLYATTRGFHDFRPLLH
jgi:membrane protease YdiL (CAAX protease family)